MTSELTLLVLRIAFIVVLWLFIFFIVYALRSDLFGQRAKRLPNEQQTATPPGGQPAQAAAAPAPAAPRPTSTRPSSAPSPITEQGSPASRLLITKARSRAWRCRSATARSRSAGRTRAIS